MSDPTQPPPAPLEVPDELTLAFTLAELAAQYGTIVTHEQSVVLSRYCRLLWDWNTKLNLTRHTTPELFVTRDLIDSIQLATHLPAGASVLDVGSGGGVPGLLLAVLRDDVNVSVCESVRKKARVLEDLVTRLGLRVTVYADRGQDVLRTLRVQIVTARALASIPDLLTWLEPVKQQFDHLLLIKGPRWVDERTEASERGLLKSFRIDMAATWKVPGRDHESVLLRIARSR